MNDQTTKACIVDVNFVNTFDKMLPGCPVYISEIAIVH